MAMKLYRYIDGHWTMDKKPLLVELEIVRETKCGYWIREAKRGEYLIHCNVGEKERWMSKKGRYARTDPRALMDFLHRKRRQISILRLQLDRAQGAHYQAEEMEKAMILKPFRGHDVGGLLTGRVEISANPVEEVHSIYIDNKKVWPTEGV